MGLAPRCLKLARGGPTVLLLLALGCSGGQTEAADPLAGERPVATAPTGSGVRAIPAKPAAQGPLALPRPILNVVLDAGPGALLAEVPLRPVRDGNGKFAGFAVESIFGGNPMAARFGVKPGDVLLKIAGQRLVTPGDLSVIFGKLRTANELVVDVRRRGEALSFRCPIVETNAGEPPVAEPEAP